MESTLPDLARRQHAQSLADEVKSLIPGVERAADLLIELRTDDLYRTLGHGTWETFCTEHLGMSKWTANRMIAGSKPKPITAGQSVAAVQAAPVSDGDALKSATTRSTETEEVTPDVPGSPDPAFQRPLNPPELVDSVVLEGGAPSGNTAMVVDSLRRMGQPEQYLDSLSPAELRAALGLACVMLGDEPRNEAGKVPTLREEAASVFSSLLNATEGIGAKWTVEEATAWEKRSRREMATWRKAHNIEPEPERRQGTISRPEDRAAARETNGHKSMHNSPTAPQRGPLGNRPLAIAASPRRSHADDCRCYGCAPPKKG